MKKEDKKLFEAIAARYLDLAGISLNEEVEDMDKLSEPVEGATSGGENLVNPIDHSKVTSGEDTVSGVEILDIGSGEVKGSEITVEKIQEIVQKVKELISSR